MPKIKSANRFSSREAMSTQFSIHKQHDSNLFSLEIKGIPVTCSREEVVFLQTLLADTLRENPDVDEAPY